VQNLGERTCETAASEYILSSDLPRVGPGGTAERIQSSSAESSFGRNIRVLLLGPWLPKNYSLNFCFYMCGAILFLTDRSFSFVGRLRSRAMGFPSAQKSVWLHRTHRRFGLTRCPTFEGADPKLLLTRARRALRSGTPAQGSRGYLPLLGYVTISLRHSTYRNWRHAARA